MFKTKIVWALVLGVVTSVLLREARINLAYSPLWRRIPHALTAAGTHLVAALNTPGALLGGWTRFWAAVAFTCNLIRVGFGDPRWIPHEVLLPQLADETPAQRRTRAESMGDNIRVGCPSA